MDNDSSKQVEIPSSRRKFTGKSKVVVIRWLFVLLGVIWFLLGVGSVLRVYTTSTNIAGIGWIIASLMFVNSAVLFLIGWGINRGNKLYFYLALIVLAGNIILTVTDEFGLLDMITLVVDNVLLILLLVTRAEFMADKR